MILNHGDLWGNVECVDIYKNKEWNEKKRMTFRICASDYNKTLNDKDISAIIEKITKKVLTKYEAKTI